MESDFLVIGSGIAGLSYALRCAELGTVVVVTKKKDVDTATNLAQGGIAAVLEKDDSVDSHVEDTLLSGAGLCDEKIVRMVVEGGPERVADLIELGVRFVEDRKSFSGYSLGMEGGHSHRRVAHSYDLTGREIERALLEKVRNHRNIELLAIPTVLPIIRDPRWDAKWSDENEGMVSQLRPLSMTASCVLGPTAIIVVVSGTLPHCSKKYQTPIVLEKIRKSTLPEATLLQSSTSDAGLSGISVFIVGTSIAS